jgi:peptide chain release factor 1
MALPASLLRRLGQALDRYALIEARMSAASDGAEITKLAREYAELKPAAEAISAMRAAEQEMADLDAMIADASADAEMRALAREEREALAQRLPGLERAVQLMLLPKEKDDSAQSLILEIRAGTGGDEAALFAGDLLRMYQRYASVKGWKFELDDLSESDLGGVKEATATIRGEGVYARMRYESGVHRVQRVPETEAGGRIHTSAATVAVLPEPEDVDVVIDDKDIRIDTMRASGAGGQHVNRTDSAVRITHLPTGIVVISQLKSQHQNRAQAMIVLRARLYDQQRGQADAARAAERKGQIGSGDRSERIRTYNFPQGRVTDHRINLTLYNLADVIEGGRLDDVIEPLLAEAEAKKLAALEED